LGLTQNRKGPNKVGIVGLLQPFSDGLKLFSKEEVLIWFNNKRVFFISPFFTFFIRRLLWRIVFSYRGFLNLKLALLFFLFCVGIGVYGVIFSGWSSNSKYRVLGSLRAVAQTISYELILSFAIFLLSLVYFSYCFNDIYFLQRMRFFFFLFLRFSVMFFISCVVETNRAPFDLSEGESELVSGFNTEYGGLKFSLIFLGEYSTIIWMGFINTIIFWHANILVLLVFLCLFLWIRSSYPRFRYDYLIMLLWKSFMVVILLLFLWFVI